MKTHLSWCAAAFAMSATYSFASESILFVSAFGAGEKAGIHAFDFDSERGRLRPLKKNIGVQNPFFIALSPDRRFLFATDAEKFGGESHESIAVFAVEGRTGELRFINRQSTRGSASCYLDVDSAGRTVLVANYKSGSVASLPVNSDGSLKEVVSLREHSGVDDGTHVKKGAHAHCIAVSPDSRFALAADLGIDQVLVYEVDSVAGRLEPETVKLGVKMKRGSGPRHIVFHPSGKTVYVINETANTVVVLQWNPSNGTLSELQTISTLPTNFGGKSYTADLKLTPDGKYLYGTNRGHDSIACYSVGEGGLLTFLGTQSSEGKGPQNLLVSPDGRWLLCANMPGNKVVVFRIDTATGFIAPIGESADIPMPSCLRWLE